MIRKIIKIDEELCNGCGICVDACHESAIGLVDGKAKLLRDDYCDGLGNCLPACPTGAISFEEREALPYNEEEVNRNIALKELQEQKKSFSGGCPGTRMHTIRNNSVDEGNTNANKGIQAAGTDQNRYIPSQLRQWPVQIQLVPVNAPYFEGSDLLIAADCTAYAFGDFHSFMKNKVTLIGCPKLDAADYASKLTDILVYNDLKSITVIRMEVPCCGGIVSAVQTALKNSGKIIPWRIVTISTDGVVLDDRG